MSFREVGGGGAIVKYKECSDGDVLVEGHYRGSREGEHGVLYDFETDTGGVTLPKSAVLDDRMKRIKEGDYVRVTYKGTQPSKRGIPMHIFKVQVDDDRRSGEPGEEEIEF